MVVRTKRIILKPKGIKNIGNTCFFNSSIQCLLSIGDLIAYYKDTVFDNKMPISKAFSEFIQDYDKSSLVSPNRFQNIINDKINLFDGSQQDSHEFVIRFLELLHDELPNNSKGFTTKEQFMEHCNNNIISKLFYSFNKQTVLCPSCGFKSESFVLLNMMQINVKESTQIGLTQIFEKEKIDGSNVWKCEGCSYSKSAIKSLEVLIYPHILILYIKRFNSMMYKNNNSINIDEKIKFGTSTYFYMGVVCHSGSLNEGHYFSNAKRGGTWISFNDSQISPNTNNFSGNNPYMVFYKIDNYNESVIIRSVELINFMCHDHLIINFNKPFTCIGGRNGSGKSAVMISLGILFGQRSSNLERGNSFKNLIKTGEQYFSIRCILNNTKKFMYDFFGDHIILEKKVTLKSSSFSISNKNKKNYSTKMEDLEYLLDFFNIKLENPLNYLTQEQSKRFLSSSDPSHLYKLFMKGTEIADIKLINDKYEVNIFKLKEKINNIEKSVQEINEEFDKEKKRMEILSNVDKLKNILRKDENELKWSDVYLINKEAEYFENEIKNVEKEIELCQFTNTQILEESEELKKQKLNLIEFTQSLKISNKEKMTQIDEDLKIKNKTIRNMENDLRELKESFEMKKKIIKRLEKSNTFVNDREKLNLRKKEMHKKLKESRMNQEEFENIVRIEKQKRDEMINKSEEFKKSIWTLEKKIEFCKKNNENDLLHPQLQNISNQIKQTNFNEEVFGPIANYVRLKEKKWWKTASIILRNFLTTFICFCREDRDKLLKIFKNYNSSFTILIPSSKSKNIINYEKNKEFVTLIDILEIKNNVVLNQLIVMAGIEQIALIEDRTIAYSSIRKKPFNIDCIYTLTGDKIKQMNGSVSDFAPRKQEKYYFENPENKLKNYQAELDRLLQNKPQIKISSEYDQAVKDHDRILMTINTLERKLNELEREIENAEDMFSCQQEVLNNEEIYSSFKLLESQINIINNKITSFKKEILRLNEEKDSISNTQYPSIYDIDKKLHKTQCRFNVANDNHLKLVQKKVNLNEKFIEKFTEFEIKKKSLLDEIEEIPNPRPKEIVIDEMNKINLEIEESNKIGDKQETEEKIKEIIEKKKMNEKILNFNKYKVENVYESFIQRINKREEIKEFIAKNASRRFEELTSKRGYKGELLFCHEEEKLHLKMEVHNFGVAGTKETLSGGERSFAAMSLLFSLWPYISCPIKILDEFDVFMDDLNRKYIIQKFIEFFKKSKNQVILITPLNTKDLIDDDVDIQILNPPRSN